MDHHRAALDAAKEFLEFVRSSEKPTLRGLAMRLDNLATLMWPLNTWIFEEGIPERDWHTDVRDWSAIAETRFPDLERETIQQPRNISSVVDIAEICVDIEESMVVESLSDEKQAAQHLCWKYWHHFGLHVRDVQLHLYMLMSEDVFWDDSSE